MGRAADFMAGNIGAGGSIVSMAIANQEWVAKALELLKEGLAPFAEREIRAVVGIGRRFVYSNDAR